jgi:hypothetical protein
MAAGMSGLKRSSIWGVRRPQGGPKDVRGLLTLPAFSWAWEEKVQLSGAAFAHEARAPSGEWLAEVETWRYSTESPNTRRQRPIFFDRETKILIGVDYPADPVWSVQLFEGEYVLADNLWT